MNPAAEHIILWHLKRCDLTEYELETLTGALFRGHNLRQADAIELSNQYLEIARTEAKGLEEEEVIETLYRLHLIFEALDADERLVTSLEEVRAILAVTKDNPLADRIAKAKIATIAKRFS